MLFRVGNAGENEQVLRARQHHGRVNALLFLGYFFFALLQREAL